MSPSVKVKGRITDGVRHFRVRMTRYADVFERATGSQDSKTPSKSSSSDDWRSIVVAPNKCFLVDGAWTA